VMDVMSNSRRRTDEQLVGMLHETADWVIAGRGGRPLEHAANLVDALAKADAFLLEGGTVTAVYKNPGQEIIIFSGQAERLRAWLAVPVAA